MCNVSMIMDTYKPYIPDPYVQPWRPVIPNAPPAAPVPAKQVQELRELIESFKQAVKAAQTFDRLTGQPDCVDPEKAELERRLDAMAEAAK
jgi:hypothetical protein